LDFQVKVKEKNSEDSDLEHGIVCRRNMDVEEGGHNMLSTWQVARTPFFSYF